jgi:hypothetical protein
MEQRERSRRSRIDEKHRWLRGWLQWHLHTRWTTWRNTGWWQNGNGEWELPPDWKERKP